MTRIMCRHGEVACGVVCPGCAAALKSGHPFTVLVTGDSNGVVEVAIPAIGAVVSGEAEGAMRDALETMGREVHTDRARPTVPGYSDRTGFVQSCSSHHYREYYRLCSVGDIVGPLSLWPAAPPWGEPRRPHHGATPDEVIAELVAKLRASSSAE